MDYLGAVPVKIHGIFIYLLFVNNISRDNNGGEIPKMAVLKAQDTNRWITDLQPGL